MMNSCIRIRVQLDTTPIPFPKQCWLLFDSGACRVVGDIAYLISEKFGINGASGLQVKQGSYMPAQKVPSPFAPLVALPRRFSTAYERGCSNCPRQRPHTVRACKTSEVLISLSKGQGGWLPEKFNTFVDFNGKPACLYRRRV